MIKTRYSPLHGRKEDTLVTYLMGAEGRVCLPEIPADPFSEKKKTCRNIIIIGSRNMIKIESLHIASASNFTGQTLHVVKTHIHTHGHL